MCGCEQVFSGHRYYQNKSQPRHANNTDHTPAGGGRHGSATLFLELFLPSYGQLHAFDSVVHPCCGKDP